MPIWPVVLSFLGVFVLRSVFADLSRAAFRTYVLLLVLVPTGGWVGLWLAGGSPGCWIAEEMRYWEGRIGPVAVGAAIIVSVVALLHALAWLARRLHRGPDRRWSDHPATAWDVSAGRGDSDSLFGDEEVGLEAGDLGGGDCGGVD